LATLITTDFARSEKDDEGDYLEVTVGPCESKAALTCGAISKAFTKSGEDPD